MADLEKIATALRHRLHLPVVNSGRWWGGLIMVTTRKLKYVVPLAGHYAKDSGDGHYAYDLGAAQGQYPLYDCDSHAVVRLNDIQPVAPTSMGMALWIYPARRGGVARTTFGPFPNGDSHDLSHAYLSSVA